MMLTLVDQLIDWYLCDDNNNSVIRPSMEIRPTSHSKIRAAHYENVQYVPLKLSCKCRTLVMMLTLVNQLIDWYLCDDVNNSVLCLLMEIRPTSPSKIRAAYYENVHRSGRSTDTKLLGK